MRAHVRRVCHLHGQVASAAPELAELREFDEFEELAYGVEDPVECFRDLFLGFPGEAAGEKAARQAAARELLAELDELGQDDGIDRENAAYAHALSEVAPLWGRTGRKPRTPWTKGAA